MANRMHLPQQLPCIASAMISLLLLVASQQPEQLSKGALKVREEFRESGFHWITPQQYKDINKKNNTKPYMFTFLGSHCPVCRGFLRHMRTKEDKAWLSTLSAQFNAVFIHDGYGEQLIERKYCDSGNYVPKTVFADPDGKMRTDLQSKNAGPDNPYFFLPRELVWQMVALLKEYGNKSGASKYPNGLAYDL